MESRESKNQIKTDGKEAEKGGSVSRYVQSIATEHRSDETVSAVATNKRVEKIH